MMWKKIAYGLLAAALLFVLTGMGPGMRGESAAGYKRISAAEAKEFMDAGEPYILLDVRTEAEFLERRIKGAVLIPHSEVKARAAAELPDKDALILVYCRSGRRSAMAAKDLVGLGYTRVYDFGGINSWPYATVSGSGGL